MAFSAFVVERKGDSMDQGVRTLTFDELPAGQVRIRVGWSAVNYKYWRTGMVTQVGNRVARISPLVPGVDLVGTVVAADEYEIGQPVIVHGYELGVAHHGGFAEYAQVPANRVVPLPHGLSARRAAIIGTAGFTAALSLRRLEYHGLTPDKGPVLVTGASGGVGSMSVALLASKGYDVVASTGKATEHPYLIGLPGRPGHRAGSPGDRPRPGSRAGTVGRRHRLCRGSHPRRRVANPPLRGRGSGQRSHRR